MRLHAGLLLFFFFFLLFFICFFDISFFFFFKQKTAYEIYQCDWSSDVCSSDLAELRNSAGIVGAALEAERMGRVAPNADE